MIFRLLFLFKGGASLGAIFKVWDAELVGLSENKGEGLNASVTSIAIAKTEAAVRSSFMMLFLFQVSSRLCAFNGIFKPSKRSITALVAASNHQQFGESTGRYQRYGKVSKKCIPYHLLGRRKEVLIPTYISSSHQLKGIRSAIIISSLCISHSAAIGVTTTTTGGDKEGKGEGEKKGNPLSEVMCA
jgi:hypothetical protein